MNKRREKIRTHALNFIFSHYTFKFFSIFRFPCHPAQVDILRRRMSIRADGTPFPHVCVVGSRGPNPRFPNRNIPYFNRLPYQGPNTPDFVRHRNLIDTRALVQPSDVDSDADETGGSSPASTPKRPRIEPASSVPVNSGVLHTPQAPTSIQDNVGGLSLHPIDSLELNRSSTPRFAPSYSPSNPRNLQTPPSTSTSRSRLTLTNPNPFETAEETSSTVEEDTEEIRRGDHGRQLGLATPDTDL